MGIFQLMGCCLGFFCLLSCGFYCGGCCCKNKVNQDNLDIKYSMQDVNLNKNDFEKVFTSFII